MRQIRAVEPTEVREALATVFSDFLRYQNSLCRYDVYALKRQDIFAVHGFPVALLACENNLLGISGVGSGSFAHFMEKYGKAKEYAQKPYETACAGSKKTRIVPLGEFIESRLADSPREVAEGSAFLARRPSQHLGLPPRSLGGSFTDPPTLPTSSMRS
jgi:hypothetical protein